MDRSCCCCGIRLFPEELRACYVCSKATRTCAECCGCGYVDDRDRFHCNHCGVVLESGVTGKRTIRSEPPSS